MLDMRNIDNNAAIPEGIKGIWGVRNYIQEGGMVE